MKVAYADAKFDPVIYLCIGSAYLLAISGGSWLVWRQELTIGQLTSFSLYLGQLIWPMFAIAWLFNILERGSAAYQRIQTVLSSVSSLDKTQQKVTSASLDMPVLDLTQISYANSDSDKPVLSDLNIHIPYGALIGIVGPTGSGKSTLLRLLMRFSDPTLGNITINGQPLTSIELRQLRALFAYVPQEPYLFSLSVADNIRLACPKATMDEVIAVAKQAEIHDDIMLLPKDYQTQVGERGITLSGGQKQRISIARALLAKSPVLVLDDALSAVDAKTAMNILQNLLKP